MSGSYITNLVLPVFMRANAWKAGFSVPFVDRAASQLLKRLEVSPLEPNNFDYQGYKQFIEVCSWIDQQVVWFFKKHPTGEGIEINGGLSTRFHRVSETLEWPRFSWHSVNTPTSNDCIQYAFSNIDNYHASQTANPLSEWFRIVHWGDVRPRVVILGEDSPITDKTKFKILLSHLNTLLPFATDCLDIIFCHQLPDLKCLLSCTKHSVRIIKETTFHRQRNLFSRLVPMMERGGTQSLSTIHIRCSGDTSNKQP